MTEVNERSTSYLEVKLVDKSGAPAVPTALTYQVDCITTGTAIRASTPLTPAHTVEITLTPTDNAIVGAGNALELRRVTVVAQYGTGDQVVAEYDYTVRNVRAVS